jgi:hypothetical protein
MFSLGTIDSTSSKKDSRRTCPRSVFEAIRRPS